MTDAVRREPAGAWLVRRYPGWWRARYGDEVLALLEDRPAGWRDRLDLAHGALDAHLRGDGRRSPVLVAAGLVAGAAWTIAGVMTLAQPTPADWPGYSLDTLPLAILGALAMTAAQLGLARRAGPASTLVLELLMGIVALTEAAWALSLVVALAGGPYGAATGAFQALAAVAAVALGIVVLRAGASGEGVVLVATAGAVLVPSPIVWIALGTTWTAVGIAAAVLPEVDAAPPVASG
jgi:hypothetical protein